METTDIEWADRVWTPTKETLTAPLRWRRKGLVLVGGDLFGEGVAHSVVSKAFAVMAQASRHTFVVVTTSAERMSHVMRGRLVETCYARATRRDRSVVESFEWPLPNVIPAVRCSNQPEADARISMLLQTPARKRAAVLDPLTGRIDLRHVPSATTGRLINALDPMDALVPVRGPRLDWVIVAGAIGPKAAPCDIAHVRSVVQQCRAAGVPVWVERLGAVPVMNEDDWRQLDPVRLLSHTNHRRAPDGTVPLLMADRKGADQSAWPKELCWREVPQ